MIQNSKFPPKTRLAKGGKIQNFRKGFTLIEMLVVVFVVGIGLVGAMSFFNINLNNQFEAKNELIAAGLAQEGVDLARNIRDYNKLSGGSWDQGLNPACKTIDYRSLDSVQLSYFHKCITANNVNEVCVNASGRYYQCASGNTDFQRRITISNVQADGSRSVVCEVSWNGRTTTATDVLYDNSF